MVALRQHMQDLAVHVAECGAPPVAVFRRFAVPKAVCRRANGRKFALVEDGKTEQRLGPKTTHVEEQTLTFSARGSPHNWSRRLYRLSRLVRGALVVAPAVVQAGGSTIPYPRNVTRNAALGGRRRGSSWTARTLAVGKGTRPS